ncbi:DNA mismatch repair protein MutS [Pontibacter qinzhouensis]|uniref:DNA mismatch repair protein MutS n=1 Tax=Pontibacter qinzhouensis TaxID=2603253 RepID=A0A5C8KBY3_9BACT|nr:DNA mismatch repair protein MutS [Pontibacter qinzhouensis]TXK50881.1 DNA mismatch repair protein MutS [Pontibacter qinzhouensis]
MNHTKIESFTQRSNALEEKEKKAASKSGLISWLRVLVFVAGIVVAWYLFSTDRNAAGAVSIVIFYTLFVVVMRWHSRLDYSYQHYKLLRQLNQEEVERLQGQLDKFDGGTQFINDQHPYTSDLDIFGRNSLFQLINRSVSGIGKAKLASWMQGAAPVAEVARRQAAVGALAQPTQLNWLQDFVAKSRHYKHTEAAAGHFIDWLRKSNFYKQHPALKLLLFVLPVLTLGAIVAWFMGYSGYIAVGFLAVQYLVSYKYTAARDEYYEKSIGMYEAIRSYKDQLQHIEPEKFNDPFLEELRSQLFHDGAMVSGCISKLSTIIDYFSWRLSTLMSFFLNTILMWDFFWMYRLESWKQHRLDQVEHSFEVLATFEALASIASFQYANPHYAVPELSSVPFKFKAEQLAHPLIFSVQRVANDFEMQGAGKTMVVTGSNMSGKTTFLRTVGINIVLALMGAPACADKLKVAPVQVYTAMRTADNLAENTSSFYAELKRLRILLNMTEQEQEPVFYLLDEILKGTNSRDRHAGAMALIRQLHQRNTSGLISTHDLELGAMEQELKGSVENYSFNSTIEGDKIIFDYTLQKGICRSFNASKLMQLMGIAIEEEAV